MFITKDWGFCVRISISQSYARRLFYAPAAVTSSIYVGGKTPFPNILLILTAKICRVISKNRKEWLTFALDSLPPFEWQLRGEFRFT